jgi:hypothetical protein
MNTISRGACANSNSNPIFNKQNNLISEISKNEYEFLKCEFCDEHIKRRYLELKDIFYKIYKNFIKIIKLIKIKDEINLRKIIDDTGLAQKEYLKYKHFVEKLIILKKNNFSPDANKYVSAFLIHTLDYFREFGRKRKKRFV